MTENTRAPWQYSAGLLPLPKSGAITPSEAKEWLADWAGEFIRAIGCGFDRALDPTASSAFSMLACDVSYRIDACGLAAKSGRPVRIEWQPDLDDPQAKCREIAAILANRAEDDGPIQEVYDQLAQRLVDLLAQPMPSRAA